MNVFLCIETEANVASVEAQEQISVLLCKEDLPVLQSTTQQNANEDQQNTNLDSKCVDELVVLDFYLLA
tara:strand:- start:84 stop:290 length:207 start_codon:yes stop_codon:yes gene_type:complete